MIRIYVYAYIYTNIQTNIHTYMHPYIQTYMHTHIHTCIHTYTYIYIYLILIIEYILFDSPAGLSTKTPTFSVHGGVQHGRLGPNEALDDRNIVQETSGTTNEN